ncbi:MAG: HEPN domain-containing protein [Ferroplasma sp.]
MDLDCEEFNRWFNQARYTFNLITPDIENNGYSWACFKAQQCAEMAIKSILEGVGKNAFGHGLLKLYEEVSSILGGNDDVFNSVSYLDKLYISPRYPDAFTEGSPWEHFTENDAITAKKAAKIVISYVEREMAKCL